VEDPAAARNRAFRSGDGNIDGATRDSVTTAYIPHGRYGYSRLRFRKKSFGRRSSGYRKGNAFSQEKRNEWKLVEATRET